MIASDRTLWVPVSLLRVAELHAAIDELIRNHDRQLVLNVNVHCMNLAWENPWLREILEAAPIVFCDGAGVAVALRIFGGVRVPERITYARWMWQLAAHCAAAGHSLYLLGAKPGIVETAARKLAERIPGLRIAGVHHGYFDKQGAVSDAVIAEINRSGAQILVAGFGMPVQERWLHENRDRLTPNVLLTGGAVFDFVSGSVARGPRVLVDHGFEWLVRLAREPRRLWRRYLMGNPLFFLRAWKWTRTRVIP